MRFLLPLFLFLAACSPHRVSIYDKPITEIPERFLSFQISTASKNDVQTLWWKEFQDSNLDRLIEMALTNNQSLLAAWNRLRRVQEKMIVVKSEKYPQLELAGSVSRTRLVNPQVRGAIEAEQQGTLSFNDFLVQSGLSFELDIWERITSKTLAENFAVAATRADVENTALLLTGTVAELWFQVQEQQALIELLENQIETSKTLLELTELRFSVGRGTALDVYQQRQQLASLRAELPGVQSALLQAKNQISTLLGLPPGSFIEIVPDGELPKLPPFPGYITPVMLLDSRPDLRAAVARVQAAEYRVAQVFAERFPRLSLGLNYNFQASEFSDLFNREVGSALGNILLPIVDGGKRRARVREQQAIVDELQNIYANQFLLALQEVENALVAEKFQVELLTRLQTQVSFARATLRETRARYINGLIDYLQVTLAVESLQALERRFVSEEAQLLTFRSRLYRALGGAWTKVTVQGFANRGGIIGENRTLLTVNEDFLQ